MRRRRNTVLISVVCSALILVVTFVITSPGQRKPNVRRAVSQPAPRSSEPTGSTTSSSTPSEASPLGTAAQAYATSRTGDITAALYDLRSGQTWYLKPGDEQATASIVKIDILGTLLAQSTSSGQPISAANQTLMASMIEVSDNDDATTLWNAVGGPSSIDSFNRDIGMTQTTPSTCLSCPGFDWPGWGLTMTTAADQITLLRNIVLPSADIGNAQRQDAIGLMENVSASENWGVTGGVLPGVTVALKNGWVPLSSSLWQVNSIGWIDGDGRNYLLAVLTDGNPTEDYGITSIEGISGADLDGSIGGVNSESLRVS